MQTSKPHHWHCSVTIIINLVHISHPTAVSPAWFRAEKCRHGRHFLEIKPNLRILTVKPNLNVLDLTQSLCRVYSHIHGHIQDGSHLLLLFLKCSRLFKQFFSFVTTCQIFETKNLIEFRPYFLLFTKFIKKIRIYTLSTYKVVLYQPRRKNVTHKFIWKILFYLI